MNLKLARPRRQTRLDGVYELEPTTVQRTWPREGRGFARGRRECDTPAEFLSFEAGRV